MCLLYLSCRELLYLKFWDKRRPLITKLFDCFSTKTYVVGAQKNRLNETGSKEPS